MPVLYETYKSSVRDNLFLKDVLKTFSVLQTIRSISAVSVI